MTQIIIGIDIGAHGAIAIFKDDKLHEVVDMPIFTMQKKSGKNKTTVNPYALANILRIYAYAYGGEIKAVMELVGATPQMGVTSAYAFGNAAGIVQGVLGALEIPYVEIAPQVWKAFAGIRVVNASTMTTAKSREIGKEMARAKVVKMFPEHEEQFRLKKHDGRADACLIGWYGLKRG